MKKLLLFLINLTLIAFTGWSQRQLQTSLPSQTGDEIHLDFKFADSIEVIPWNKNEVLVRVSVNINDNKDNEDYDLKSDKSGHTLHFYSVNTWAENRKGDCCCNQAEIFYEVYMPASLDFYSESISGNMKLDGLSGFININTISGDITLKTPPERVKVKTISGDVEFLIAKGKKADFSLSTISGDIYSNIDFEFLDNKSGLKQVGGRSVKGRINGGGASWRMDTISGNIYLREI